MFKEAMAQWMTNALAVSTTRVRLLQLVKRVVNCTIQMNFGQIFPPKSDIDNQASAQNAADIQNHRLF